MSLTKYIVCCVRADLPSKEQILVQATHAGIEAGVHFGRKEDNPYTLLVFVAKDEFELRQQMVAMEKSKVRFRYFVEPDQNYEMTAFATEPITQITKDRVFTDFRLFSFDDFFEGKPEKKLTKPTRRARIAKPTELAEDYFS